jgi:PAS domain S-box-containing protein
MSAPDADGPAESDPLSFLSGGGEMGRLIRLMDWSGTPLGPVQSWPQSLRTAVSLCLASNFPINIIWGPGRVQIYNDGYRPICGGKHPRSMGQDFQECWESAWPVVGRAFDQALSGRADFLENQRMFLDRHGFLEETFFSYSFSPIRDETGNVGGLFHPVNETTAKMLSERRTRALRDPAARTGKAKSVAEALDLTGQTLAGYDLDLPFVLLYAIDPDGQQARLVATTGLPAGTPGSPETIDLTASESSVSTWPLAEAVRSKATAQVDDVARRLGPGPSPCGPYPEPPRTALVIPITPPGVDRPAVVIVAGVSLRLPLNEAYRSFYDLLASGVTTAAANARAYEEEKRRAEALAELDRAKTAFFSNVSHEFRTPLTLILGPVEDLLARGEPEVSPTAAGQLAVVHRNSLRLLKLVNTMLDFSRIEAGRIQAHYEPVDLAALTAELASVFRAAVERAGIRLVVACPPLPEPVYVDRDMWEKIVLNLLSNAFKFTLDGEIAVHLEVHDGQAVLTVRNTGVGIPAEEMPRIFERFHRVRDTRGRTHEGTGIGLALVQELVKLHGGTVRAESVLGAGSRFEVCVPLGVGHLDPRRIGTPSDLAPTTTGTDAFVQEALRWLPDGSDGDVSGDARVLADAGLAWLRAGADARDGDDGAAAARGPRARVLWADDNTDMREYVARLLSRRFDVVAVADGQAALEVARSQPPELVLTDVMMPRLDGVGLLRELRADPRLREIPVILLSARAGEEARVGGMAEGADDYLIKPFNSRELLARVEAHARMSQLRHEATEAVRRSEERLRRMVNIEGVGVLTFDAASGTLLDANDHFLRMSGYSRGEVASRALTWRTLTPPEYVAESERQMAGLAATGRLGPYEKEYLRKNGSRSWMVFAGAALGDGTVVEYCIDVSDHKRTEAALRASEERFRALVTATSYAVYRMSPDWSEMWRLEGRGFIADTADPSADWRSVYIPEEEQPKVMTAIRQAVRSKRMFELEHRVRRADGTLGWTLSRAVPLLDASGEITEWFGAASDVTARRQAEEALRESEERLRLALEAARMGIWTWDFTADRATYHAHLNRLLGRDAVETTGPIADFLARVHPDDQPGVRAQLYTAASRRGGFTAEFRVVWPDGTVRWLRGQGDVVTAGGGSYLTGAAVDVTQRREAEDALRLNEVRMAAAFAGTGAGLSDLSPSGPFLQVNSELCQMLGRTREQLLEARLADVIHPQDRAVTLAALHRVWTTAIPVSLDKRYLRTDGSVVYARSNLARLDVPGERPRAVLVVTFDLTDRRQLETAARDCRERLEMVLEAARMGLWTWDPTTGTQTRDPNLNRLLGLEPVETRQPLGEFISHCVHRDDRPVVSATVNANAVQRRSFDLEFRVVQPDGSVRWLRDHGKVFGSPSGDGWHLAGACVDVTDLKEAQAAVRACDERLRQPGSEARGEG